MEITCLAFMLMFFLNSFGKGHVGVEKLFGNKIMGEAVNMAVLIVLSLHTRLKKDIVTFCTRILSYLAMIARGD